MGYKNKWKMKERKYIYIYSKYDLQTNNNFKNYNKKFYYFLFY